MRPDHHENRGLAADATGEADAVGELVLAGGVGGRLVAQHIVHGAGRGPAVIGGRRALRWWRHHRQAAASQARTIEIVVVQVEQGIRTAAFLHQHAVVAQHDFKRRRGVVVAHHQFPAARVRDFPSGATDAEVPVELDRFVLLPRGVAVDRHRQGHLGLPDLDAQRRQRNLRVIDTRRCAAPVAAHGEFDRDHGGAIKAEHHLGQGFAGVAFHCLGIRGRQAGHRLQRHDFVRGRGRRSDTNRIAGTHGEGIRAAILEPVYRLAGQIAHLRRDIGGRRFIDIFEDRHATVGRRINLDADRANPRIGAGQARRLGHRRPVGDQRAGDADAAIAFVGDPELVPEIDGQAGGLVEPGLAHRAAVPREPRRAGADVLFEATVAGDAQNAVLPGLGDIEPALLVQRQRRDGLQLGLRRGTAQAGTAGHARTSHRGDDALRRHPPDPEVAIVGDVKGAVRCDRQGPGRIQAGAARWPAVTGETRDARACERRDDTRGRLG